MSAPLSQEGGSRGDRETRGFLLAVVRDSLPGLALVLSALYAVLVPAHLWFVEGRAGLVMSALAFTTAGVCAMLSTKWRRRPPSLENAHLLLASLVGVTLANSSLHMFFDSSPPQTTNFALIALGSGFSCLSQRWLVFFLALNLACWATLAWAAPPAEGWVHFSFFLLMANVLAVTFHLVRFWNLEGLASSNLVSQRAQAALLRSEASLRSAQRLAHLGSYEFDLDTGAHLRWSEETFQIVGVDPLGGPPSAGIFLNQIVHPDDRAWVDQAMQRARKGEELAPFVYRITRTDGSIRYVETFGKAGTRSSDGRGTWIGTLRDVTRRELADQALRQQQEELNHAARLGTMGEMAAALAHELHQPLAAIVNYARGCARRLESHEHVDMPAMQDALSEICTQAERSSEILRTLWGFARKQAPERQWVDFDLVGRDVLHLVDFEARQEDISVRLDTGGARVWVHVDPIQAAQVLLNLVRNGFDAIRAGEGPSRELSIAAQTHESGWVEIAVRDTGCGLSAEMRDQLFDPFTTTKTTGLGLGLSISRRIVESYGGRIHALSNPTGGSTFVFTLPGRIEEVEDAG